MVLPALILPVLSSTDDAESPTSKATPLVALISWVMFSVAPFAFNRAAAGAGDGAKVGGSRCPWLPRRVQSE